MRARIKSLLSRGCHALLERLNADGSGKAQPRGTDPLTGLYPLTAFSERLRLEIARAGDYLQEVAVVVFTIPNAAASERHLCEMGRALRQGSRGSADIPARIAPNQLGVLLPNTGSGAAAAAARLAPALAAAGDCPVASGAAWYPKDALQASELLALAIQRSRFPAPAAEPVPPPAEEAPLVELASGQEIGLALEPTLTP